jgi:regulatory protein
MAVAEGNDALESALRALRHRDRSVADLDRRLAERGFGSEERVDAVEALQRTGLLDDERFARNRAESLSSRGAGDELIRHDLAGSGVESGLAEHAIESLEPEVVRARRIVERRGASAKTVRYLYGRGFSHDVVSAVVATGEAGELP